MLKHLARVSIDATEMRLKGSFDDGLVYLSTAATITAINVSSKVNHLAAICKDKGQGTCSARCQESPVSSPYVSPLNLENIEFHRCPDAPKLLAGSIIPSDLCSGSLLLGLCYLLMHL